MNFDTVVPIIVSDVTLKSCHMYRTECVSPTIVSLYSTILLKRLK